MNQDFTKYDLKLDSLTNKFKEANNNLKLTQSNTSLLVEKLKILSTDFSKGYSDIINDLTKIFDGLNHNETNKTNSEIDNESPAGFNINKIINFDKNESYLLNDNYCNTLIEWLEKDTRFERIYKATNDGFSGDDFHRCCDKKGPNVVVVSTSTNRLLGGYTPLSWGDMEGYNNDSSLSGFLFSFDMMTKFKMKEGTYAICSSAGSGPKYGGGHDLDIVGNCNTNQNYYSGIGFTYEWNHSDKSLLYGSNDGTFKYLVTDYEVYRLI